MKKICFLFWLLCKRSLKKPSFLIILLAFPLSGFLFASVSKEEETGLLVALYGEEGDDFSTSIIHRLCQSDYHLLSFYNCSSIENLKKDVLTGRAQWGYIFPKDFETRLQTGKARESISVLSSPSSLFVPVSNEIVFSRVMESHSLFLLKQSLEENFPSSSSLFSMAENFYEHHLTSKSSFSFPILSILSPSVLAGAFALLGLYAARQGQGFFIDIVKMAFYILLLLVYCLLLKLLFRNFTRLSFVIPFLLLGSLIFSPVFIDFGSFSPFFRILSFLFPPTFYLL